MAEINKLQGPLGIYVTPDNVLNVLAQSPGGGISISGNGTNAPGFRLHDGETLGTATYNAQNILALSINDGVFGSAIGDYVIANKKNFAIHLATNDSIRQTITNDGKTGFGIQIPNRVLHVKSSGSADHMSISGALAPSLVFHEADTSAASNYLAGFTLATNTGDGVIGTVAGDFVYVNRKNNAIRFATNNTLVATITANGLISSNVATYDALITADGDIINKKYLDSNTMPNYITTSGHDWNTWSPNRAEFLVSNTNGPLGTTSVHGIFIPHGTGATNTYGTVIAGRLNTDAVPDAPTLWFKNLENSVWTDWMEIIHSGNVSDYISAIPVATSSILGGVLSGTDISVDGSGNVSSATSVVPIRATDLAASQDLNNYQTAGFYYQSSNAEAVSGSNYPSAYAGSLMIQKSAGVTQQYHQYNISDTTELYLRSFYSAAWSPWVKVWHSGNDGSGSGLDADLLDGITSTGFARSYGRLSDDLNTMMTDGMYGYRNTNANRPASLSYMSLITAANSDTGLQISGGYNTNRLFFRGWSGSGTTWYPWNELATLNTTQTVSGAKTFSTSPQIGSTVAGATHMVLETAGQLSFKIDNMTGGWARGMEFNNGSTTYGGFWGYGTSSTNLSYLSIGKLYNDFGVRVYPDAQTELAYNNTIRLATTSTGVAVTGVLDVSGDEFVDGKRRRDTTDKGFLVGSYNQDGGLTTSTGCVYTMGTSYYPTATTLGNMYGIGFCHGSASFINSTDLGTDPGSRWGMYVAADGNARVFLDASLGRVYAKSYHYGADFILHSDRRLKNSISDLELGIDGLIPKRFKRNGEKDWQYGFIAQELLETHSEIVRGSDKDNYTVSYNSIIALLVKDLKEEKEKVIELKNKISDLSSRLEKLEQLLF